MTKKELEEQLKCTLRENEALRKENKQLYAMAEQRYTALADRMDNMQSELLEKIELGNTTQENYLNEAAQNLKKAMQREMRAIRTCLKNESEAAEKDMAIIMETMQLILTNLLIDNAEEKAEKWKKVKSAKKGKRKT